MSKENKEYKNIKAEILLENNVATWLRQMIVTLTITLAIIVYIESKGSIFDNLLVFISILVLVITSISIGIMNLITFKKRKNALIKDGVIKNIKLNNWYLIIVISSILGFIGTFVGIILTKYKNK